MGALVSVNAKKRGRKFARTDFNLEGSAFNKIDSRNQHCLTQVEAEFCDDSQVDEVEVDVHQELAEADETDILLNVRQDFPTGLVKQSD